MLHTTKQLDFVRHFPVAKVSLCNSDLLFPIFFQLLVVESHVVLPCVSPGLLGLSTSFILNASAVLFDVVCLSE
jgi:hypothetical protein